MSSFEVFAIIIGLSAYLLLNGFVVSIIFNEVFGVVTRLPLPIHRKAFVCGVATLIILTLSVSCISFLKFAARILSGGAA